MQLADVMTPNPTVCDSTASLCDAAAIMRDQAIGDVLVQRHGQLVGIVTDRDIVTRGVADGRNPATTSVGEICTGELHCAQVDTPVDEVVRLMNDNAVRRVPVLDGGQPIGIVALGDLAVARDRSSVLGSISSAEPNG